MKFIQNFFKATNTLERHQRFEILNILWTGMIVISVLLPTVKLFLGILLVVPILFTEGGLSVVIDFLSQIAIWLLIFTMTLMNFRLYPYVSYHLNWSIKQFFLPNGMLGQVYDYTVHDEQTRYRWNESRSERYARAKSVGRSNTIFYALVILPIRFILYISVLSLLWLTSFIFGWYFLKKSNAL
ncbi:hypothetical protein [Streptococcus gallolyticus]|uniref:hypothetical protein n=1 Tax=Streptococcus gallolyticus TaxID=315405 RepID=UPI002284EE8D|nr:hypothetical protein [Streptococcus gallolyticus]MCY7189387.1 hypothetical protein [Streptococcus gallolyticus subsp. gallolyticus]